MTRPRWLRNLMLGMAFVAMNAPAVLIAANTTSAVITAQTAAALPLCLQWRPVGACLWLVCSFFGCSIEYSLKVRNYLPDVVVNVRNAGVPNPWTELTPVTAASAGTLSALVASTLGGIADGHGDIGQTGEEHRSRQATVYRDVDVIGHPASAISLLGVYAYSGYVCPPKTIPMFPYLLSEADALSWRGIAPIESLYPMALIPGLREIGSFPLNTWGSVYPRIGEVVQQDTPKASAVFAQRAGDITTRYAQPHVYVPIDAASNYLSFLYRWWGPPALVEGDPSTGTWQMLSPRPDVSCYTFGQNDSITPWSWSDLRFDDGGDYLYNLWRPHECCQVRGAFITSVP